MGTTQASFCSARPVIGQCVATSSERSTCGVIWWSSKASPRCQAARRSASQRVTASVAGRVRRAIRRRPRSQPSRIGWPGHRQGAGGTMP